MVMFRQSYVKSMRLPDWKQDILVTISAVTKRFKINSLQFINNFNTKTFPRGTLKGKFNMLPSDKVTEQTLNKDQKGPSCHRTDHK